MLKSQFSKANAHLFDIQPSRAKARQGLRRQLSVEPLEQRAMLSAVTYGESSVGFGALSNGVPNITSSDLANGMSPTQLNVNTIASGYGNPATLTDGMAINGGNYIPTNDYQLSSVAVNNDAIIQIDLGSSKFFTQINTYSEAFSWAGIDRVWQGYKVYGSNTSILASPGSNDTTAELANNPDLTLLATVDTVPLQDKINEKYVGVSVSGDWDSYQYVVFDFQSPYEMGHRLGSFFGTDSGQDTARRYTRFREIDIVNSYTPPVAVDDNFATDEDSSTTINVLANDSVNSGGTLAITSVSAPNFGTVVVDGRGTSTTSDDRIVYTPSLNDSGTATFQYTITDGLGNNATAHVTVEVTPVNDAPVVDLNGQDETGIDFTTIFVGSATLLSDADALLTDVDGGVIGSATAGNGDIFVVNIDGRVTKIDPTTGAQTPISSGALISNARGLAIDDATGNIYVADTGGRAVVKVDRNTGAETIVATGLSSPWGIAVEADGKVLVTELGTSSIIRVNPATGVKTTVKSGLYAPYGIEVASDGTILAADGRYLRKINPTNGAMTSTAFLGFWSYDIAEDASGALIVTDYSRIRRVDFTTGSSTIIASNVFGYSIAMGADNDIVASSYGNGNVKVIDGSTGTLSVLASGGNLSGSFGVDIDGGVVYGDNITSLTVSITNLLDGASEVLTADVSGTAITASYNSATGVLSLTGDDTAANYQAVLSTITYNNTATSPTSTARVIKFMANDGLDSSQPAAFATVVLNRPPVINDQSFSLNENLTAIGSVVATDPDTGDTLTYSIGGGLDAAKFEINSSTGALTFRSAPDYENPTDAGGNNVYDVMVTVTDGKSGSDTGNIAVTVTNVTAVISGTVFVDANGNGLYDGGTETAINGVTVKLLDSSALAELAADVTEFGGVYAFTVDDEFATYVIREIQPTGVTDGAAILGSAAVDEVLSSNEMRLTLAGVNASDYDFTEVGQAVQSGDTATIGFWQNKNGQALIKQAGNALVPWLKANFGNVFGTRFSDSVGGDNPDEVASFYKAEFFDKKLKGTPKVDAQFMSLALATFFTSSSLSGGSLAASYGFNVTATGIGTNVVNIGSSGAAFNVANNTNMTIMSMLLATNSLTGADANGDGYSNAYDTNGDGVLDDNEKALRALANAIYSAINEDGDI